MLDWSFQRRQSLSGAASTSVASCIGGRNKFIRTLAELSSSFSFTHFFQMLHGLEEDATGEQHSPKPKMTRVAHSTLVDNPNKMHNLGRSSADEMPLDAPSILRHTAESPNWANAPKVAPTLNLYSKKARPTRRGINQPNVI